MATLEHKDIPDANLHEPKGVASANDLEVYVAGGTGSGVWQYTSISHHGQMTVTNNATATPVTAAADTTLNTDSDYSKVVAGWGAGHLQNITFSTDKIVVPIDGHYRISFWASIKVPLNNNFIGIKYAVNDTAPYSAQKLVSQSVTANDYKNMFGSALALLSAGQSVSIYLAGTKSDSIVIEEAGLQIELVHEG